MFTELLASGSGGIVNQVSPNFGFSINTNRLEYKKGYFYVENGICYVDAIYIAKTSLSGEMTLFGEGTTCIPSTNQGTSFIPLGDIKVRYDSNINLCFFPNGSFSAGNEMHFIGNFYTSANDTLPVL